MPLFIEEGELVRVDEPVDPYLEVTELADRFVKGACPRCGADDQYGDNCEACGATYSPAELIDPVSAISGATPVDKASVHFFFRLQDFEDMLRSWIDSGSLQPQVANKLREWTDAGLQEWDISRDAPYFGFEIPDQPGKYFYVWLDAPIGYIASFYHYCARTGQAFDDYWQPGGDTELYHFIGKDIINFHGLFWPAMLHEAGLRMPTGVFVHGFLTVDGTKMSKSRGNVIAPDDLVQAYGADAVRAYLMFFARWELGAPAPPLQQFLLSQPVIGARAGHGHGTEIAARMRPEDVVLHVPVAHHLGHPLGRTQLDALHQRDHHRVGLHQVAPRGEVDRHVQPGGAQGGRGGVGLEAGAERIDAEIAQGGEFFAAHGDSDAIDFCGAMRLLHFGKRSVATGSQNQPAV